MKNEQLASVMDSSIFLPYSPRLRELLKSYGASLLLIYWERLFAATQDTTLVVDVDRTRSLFCLAPITFSKHLAQIAVYWPSAKRRELARLAGREFLTRATFGAGAYKPYSFVRISKTHIELRRNEPRIRLLLAQAGCLQLSQGDLLSSGRNGDVRGFHVDLADFNAESMVRELREKVDGRRTKGVKRRFANRSPWTAERRERFRETMIRRGYWGGDKRSISDVD